MSGKRRVSGTKLAAFRTARKLDQSSLAARLRVRGLGTNQAQVSRWENGQEPRAYALPAIAAELGVKVEELYGDDEDEESSLFPPADAMLDALEYAVVAAREKKARTAA